MIIGCDHIQIINLCQQSIIGKKLPNALYVHVSAIAALVPQLQECDRKARLLREHPSLALSINTQPQDMRE